MIKLKGQLQLIHGRDNGKGERNDRILFLGGQVFAKNPDNHPPGFYAEIEGIGENWGDQRGMRFREIVSVQRTEIESAGGKALK